MNYNNPQHSTTKYSCTPFPILKENDTSGGIVTYLDLVDLGSLTGFGVDLTEIGGERNWNSVTIDNWKLLFEAINDHLTVFNNCLKTLEASPDAIIITLRNNNQLEANVDGVTWSSNSQKITVNPTTGKTTTYSLASSATSYGSFELSASASSIPEGSEITITAQWTGNSTPYNATITATKSGMTSATQAVTLYKQATCPSSVSLSNGKSISLNNNGYGTITYIPTKGDYTITTQGNETQGSCSFTVTNAQPNSIIITEKSNNQLEANVDGVTWRSDSSSILVNPTTGKTTTYSLASSATSYGSFELSASASSIQEGSNITITAQWTGNSTPYRANITASKSGMTQATKAVTLYKQATRPSSVSLSNGKTISLDSNGYGTVTYAPSEGYYTITTQGNETQGSCSFTVTPAAASYYWYAGEGPINSSSRPGSNANWHAITGTPTKIVTGELSNEEKINWVIAVPTVFGLNRISNGEDITDIYNVTTVTCADGIEYTVFTQVDSSKKMDVEIIHGESTPNNNYWYAGEGPINSSSRPGSDSNWHLIEGTPTKIVTGELSNSTKINWVIAVPTSLNLNHISNGEDITDIYDVATVTCANGVEYITFTQVDKSKKMDVEIIQ